ncbi:MAG: ribonuclease III [Clostridia bacterium]|nr:ribonuclease III [Clostridia bacterium]
MTNKRFCETIKYDFKDESLLVEALTHSSYANEHKGDGGKLRFNERLEFFGDAILEFLCSEYLFEKFKNVPEGTLTKMRAAAVCEDSLAVLGGQIGIGEALYLGRGEEQNGGRENPSIIADAFEALLAAIYLDGGREAAEDFLYPLLIPQIEKTSVHTTDYKSLLQQFIQKEPGEFVEYELTGEEGPEHSKTFYMCVKYQNNVVGRGQGKSKRAAEQAAAHDALVLFGELTDET